MALNAIMTNTLLQTEAPDHLRGQVVGFYSFIVVGMAPFGSLQAGWIAEHIGTPAALLIGGGICVVAAGTAGWVMLRGEKKLSAISYQLSEGERLPAGRDPPTEQTDQLIADS